MCAGIVSQGSGGVGITQGYRIFNTWVGDLARLVTLEAVIKEVREKDLLAVARQSGEIMLSGLRGLEVRQDRVWTKSTLHGTLYPV